MIPAPIAYSMTNERTEERLNFVLTHETPYQQGSFWVFGDIYCEYFEKIEIVLTVPSILDCMKSSYMCKTN